MGKILLFVSLAVTLIAAGLGFANKSKVQQAVEQKQAAEAAAQQANTKLAGTEKQLKDANDKVTQAAAAAKSANDQIASLNTQLQTAQSQVTDLTAKSSKAEADLAAANSALEAAKNAANNTAPTPAPTTGPSIQELQAQIEELKTVNTKLQSQIDSEHTELEGLRTEKANRTKGLVQKGIEGRVLAVNPAWNFVVLSLGDKNGILANSELLVKRGNQMIGKLRVTSVEPSTSIADIVSNSVPNGLSISPNDQVIVAGE